MSPRELWLFTVPSLIRSSAAVSANAEPEPVPQHHRLALHLGQRLQGLEEHRPLLDAGTGRPPRRGRPARRARGATDAVPRRCAAHDDAAHVGVGRAVPCTLGQATYSLVSAVCSRSSARCQSPHTAYAIRAGAVWRARRTRRTPRRGLPRSGSPHPFPGLDLLGEVVSSAASVDSGSTAASTG